MLLLLFVSIRFQVCFTPLIGVLFTFPSRYLFAIGHRVVLKDQNEALPVRGYHLLWLTFPGYSGYLQIGHWPGPRSLVTTNGVSVDVLSSGYLDISVYRVRFSILCIQIKMTLRPGFPIRISADQSLLAAPHSFSQRVTSFIASWNQGIHQMPL